LEARRISTLNRRLILLVQMVANLIDEVEMLKEKVYGPQDLNPKEWVQYRNRRMQLLFSSQGATPASIRKYVPYIRNRMETATELIPDQSERDIEITGLMSQT
jgi:hypothetical protein